MWRLIISDSLKPVREATEYSVHVELHHPIAEGLLYRMKNFCVSLRTITVRS